MNIIKCDMSGVIASGTIPRNALIQKLREKAAKKNIFVTAPGGYGKTIAVTQALASARGAAVWITVSCADNEPVFFYRRLAAALIKLTGKEKLAEEPNTGLSLDGLLGMLRSLPEKNARCYLVLDDLHMLKNTELINNLALIACRLRGYICLCLISRAEAPAGILETGRFDTLTKNDLVFTQEEIEWLCAERDCVYAPERIRELHESTGGWAMYLSAILSSGSDLFSAAGKPPQTLIQYLDEKVWDLWDDETKNLLLRLSIPLEISPELCELLTGRGDGEGVLARLMKNENAFLSRTDNNFYRFHDLFRDFLSERIERYLSGDEIRKLNDIAAKWYCEREDYFSGARHYIQNGDHDGINRCMSAVNRFYETKGNVSVEARLNFIKQYIWILDPEFISENAHLISKCAAMAYYDGDAAAFKRYMDLLYKNLPENSENNPDLVENSGFVGSIDFRVPLNDYAKKLKKMIPLMSKASGLKNEARVSTITQNLPFLHRSMRDYSEYHDLHECELKLLEDTIGVMIGKDYGIMEQCLVAGIYYERGMLLEAARHALNGYHACNENTQPETLFSSHMILEAVLRSMGASQEADRIMYIVESFVEEKAGFLRPNFNALKTERGIRLGDRSIAREWLDVYGTRTERLPFYQICRHFATLRCYIAVEDYAAAIGFGRQLQALAAEYIRPLDQIESKLLTAIAIWRNGNQRQAIRMIGDAINIAMPYSFSQLFTNEGNDILPLLWELREKTGKASEYMLFVDKLANQIYNKYGFNTLTKEQLPHLSPKQRAMLSYLKKGMSYNEIAEASGLTRGTVKTHVLLVYKRLGVHSAQEAVVKAKQMGFL